MSFSRSVFILLTVVLVTSCSVQKRKYLSGFYLSWKHKSVTEQPGKGHSKTVARTRITVVSGPEATTAKVTASAGKIEIVPLKTEPVLIHSNPKDSCDIVVYRDGTEIRAKVVEISTTILKYKVCGNSQQPLVSVRKSELFMVKYGNGTKEVFKQETTPVQARSEPVENVVTRPNIRAPSLLPEAIIGFILGLVSFVALFINASGLTPGTIALILLGSMICSVVARSVCRSALRKIKSGGGEYSGKGYAVAGMILAWITLLIFIFAAVYGLTHP